MSNCKVTRLKKSLILTQIGRLRTVTPIWIHWWIWNDAQSLMKYRRGALFFFLGGGGSPIKFQRHMVWKIEDLNPIWVRLLGRSQLSNPSDLPCSRSNTLFRHISGMLGLIDMKWKGGAWGGYCFNYVTSTFDLIHDLDLGFLAVTKQLYEWFNPSVCLSCLSVCLSHFLTMFPSSYHHRIFRSYYQWQKWRPCKKLRSEVKGQGHRGKKNCRIWPRLGVSGL